MKHINTIFALIVLSVSFASGNVLAAEAAKKHHVVFHVTDSDPVKWNQVLNNAGNLQKNIGKDNVDIEVVANGPGLDMMKLESVVSQRISEAISNGIVLMPCGATMKAAKLTEKDLLPGLTVVPGGVIEIMFKQEAGWTYLKI